MYDTRARAGSSDEMKQTREGGKRRENFAEKSCDERYTQAY